MSPLDRSQPPSTRRYLSGFALGALLIVCVVGIALLLVGA